MTCTHKLGTLPCDNPEPHEGDGRGCTHSDGSWVSDRHDEHSGGEH